MTTLPGMTETDSGARRFWISVPVLVIHALVIFGPLGWLMYQNWKNPQQSIFKVKLAGPLSTGPEVGPPTRLRPSPNPGPKPEPVAEPKPVVKETSKPKPVSKPEPKPVVKETPKPKPKTTSKPKATSKPKPKTTSKSKSTATRKTPSRPVRPRTVEEAQQGVYRPSANSSKIGDGGGSNTNSAVPIGSRDLAQTYGRQNNATPGGGAEGDAEYGRRIGEYLKVRWTQPPRSLLGNRLPEVLIEIAIAADGRVTSARIVRRSGVKAMDDSVESMLAGLERVPRPKHGAVSLQVLLKTE